MNPLDASWLVIKAKRLKDQPGYNEERRKVALRAEEKREREERSSKFEKPTLFDPRFATAQEEE